ncbi:MAG: hypothetical protein MZV64_72775 [Ignavibacteriales bacterium]|nr:hypothetical protein [Ignavibacteriales bacterium]
MSSRRGKRTDLRCPRAPPEPHDSGQPPDGRRLHGSSRPRLPDRPRSASQERTATPAASRPPPCRRFTRRISNPSVPSDEPPCLKTRQAVSAPVRAHRLPLLSVVFCLPSSDFWSSWLLTSSLRTDT